MSVVPEVAETETAPPDHVQASLVDKLHPAFRTPPVVAVLATVLGLMFWRLSFRPLWHTDIWGHLSLGRLIWQTGIPATEPLMPLASGVPLIDSAWLSQLIGYGMYEACGLVGLQFLFAAVVTATLTLVVTRIYSQTHDTWCALAGLAVFSWLTWQQLQVGPENAALIRPQLAGLLLFTGLFAMLTSHRQRAVDWIAIPLMICLWANLHGSFVLGLGLIGAFCAGRATDLYRRTGSCERVCGDSLVRRNFLILELSAVAALLNPYGLALYAEVLNFSSNANLKDLVEWEPLVIRSSQGQAAAIIALAIAVCYRFSPRRVSATEMLLVVGLGAWSLWTSRMLLWWSIPATYYLMLHGSAAWKKLKHRTGDEPTAPRNGLWTAIAVGMIWVCFAGSSFGVFLLHGTQPELKRAVTKVTPIGAAEYLNEHPPQGQIFNSYEWGDYLKWAGPKNLQIFVNSHAHLVPEEVWQNYLAILFASSSSSDLLDRYSVNSVVIEKPSQKSLYRKLRDDENWNLVYDDGRAVIFYRKQPIL